MQVHPFDLTGFHGSVQGSACARMYGSDAPSFTFVDHDGSCGVQFLAGNGDDVRFRIISSGQSQFDSDEVTAQSGDSGDSINTSLVTWLAFEVLNAVYSPLRITVFKDISFGKNLVSIQIDVDDLTLRSICEHESDGASRGSAEFYGVDFTTIITLQEEINTISTRAFT